MEFPLIDEKLFSFSDDDKRMKNQYGSLFVDHKYSFALEPLALYYCKSLVNNIGGSTQCEEIPTLKLQLLHNNANDPSEKTSFIIYSDDGINILELIRGWCGDNNVRINLKVTIFNCDMEGDGVDCFQTTGLRIRDLMVIDSHDSTGRFGCESRDFNLDVRSNVCGLLTASIKLTEHAVGQLFLQRFAQSNLPGGNKRLLDDAICTDLVILAANEAEIKCHRAMLAGRSDVFRTMFENQMQEAITGVVEMRDMSEQAVRAFLGFIYYWNMKEASSSCDIALEMLVAADKYIVPDLVSAISDLIGVMPIKWFNVDMSVKLLVFTEKQRRIRENIVLDQLQEKVIRVLKSHTKHSFDILLNSQVYQELFRENHEIAMGISARFLSVNE